MENIRRVGGHAHDNDWGKDGGGEKLGVKMLLLGTENPGERNGHWPRSRKPARLPSVCRAGGQQGR